MIFSEQFSSFSPTRNGIANAGTLQPMVQAGSLLSIRAGHRNPRPGQ